MKQHKNEFDVIITDSSDPVVMYIMAVLTLITYSDIQGPAESLFGQSYYELIRDSLREGGVMASQCECIWLHLPLITKMMKFTRQLFPRQGLDSNFVNGVESVLILVSRTLMHPPQRIRAAPLAIWWRQNREWT